MTRLKGWYSTMGSRLHRTWILWTGTREEHAVTCKDCSFRAVATTAVDALHIAEQHQAKAGYVSGT